MKKIFNKELTIGACVILALLILFFGIDYLKGINVFQPANYYYVSYTNVEGLTVSSPVNASGYKVGIVRNISYEYDNPGHILVEISLDKDLKIPEGTKAVLGADILGTASIALQMPITDKYINVGDNIEGVVASGMMESVSKDVLPSVAALMPKIDSLLTTVNNLAGSPELAASMKRLDNITANLETATAQLSASMRTMPSIMNSTNSTVENLAVMSDDLKHVTASLKDMPLDSTMQNVYETTTALNKLVQTLQTDQSSLGLLLNNPDLYNNLNATVGSLDSLLIDVKKNPKRYISIKLL